MKYRRATYDDAERVMEIIRQAQALMRSRGSAQWQNGYPASDDIERDIEHGWGIVATDSQDCVIAYSAVIFDGEPVYDHLDGAWLTDRPYVVVHRLAVADEATGCGTATAFMHHIEQMALARGVTSFRADTNFDNRAMQHVLAKLGFTYCGQVAYQGAPRRAYEKTLDDETR